MKPKSLVIINNALKALKNSFASSISLNAEREKPSQYASQSAAVFLMTVSAQLMPAILFIQ